MRPRGYPSYTCDIGKLCSTRLPSALLSAYLQDNPTASFVLMQSGAQKTIVPVPIVLGLTDDTFYEVLTGLTPGQVVVVGAQTNG